jgi:aminopeptidase-like protein
MGILQDFDSRDRAQTGEQLHSFAAALYPICRSITGDGLRETLARIEQRIPLEISEVPTGTEVFDWTIPQEWNIRDAWIKDSGGRRVVDFRHSNLHVVNYSEPVRATMPLSELKPHLFTLPDRPASIPYRTAYYNRTWGFCLTHDQLQSMPGGDYEVCIDSTLEDGHLTYGECVLPGRLSDEVLISAHACHPSLANDNLSGLAVATALAELLAGRELRYTYRFIFAPGTIGAIAWLARNRARAARIRHGLVLTGIGDSGGFHYKKTRRDDTEIDRAMAHALRHSGEPSEILDFSPYGYDERQYGSPGFNLPVGCLMRSVWGTYPEYHTSADNLDFIRPEKLAASLRLCAALVDVLEGNALYRNLNPFCEPQLGKRGLYRAGGGESIGAAINARLWMLNFSDGDHSLLDIAERSALPFSVIRDAADVLIEGGLLAEVPQPRPVPTEIF